MIATPAGLSLDPDRCEVCGGPVPHGPGHIVCAHGYIIVACADCADDKPNLRQWAERKESTRE